MLRVYFFGAAESSISTWKPTLNTKAACEYICQEREGGRR
jgi:hypothetical protein